MGALSSVGVRTDQRVINGVTVTRMWFEIPGFWAGAIVGDPDSFGIQADQRMTFYPEDIRKISRALEHIAAWMDSPGEV